MAKDDKPFDIVRRGEKGTSTAGLLTFLGIRPLGTLLQTALLREPPAWGARLLTFVGLSAVPLANDKIPRLLLVGCSAGYTVKNIWWLAFVGNEVFPPQAALLVSGYNGVMDTLCSLLHLWTATSSMSPLTVGGRDLNPVVPSLGVPASVAAGALLFAVGLGVEAVSEYQRKAFKDKPANKGKVYTGGLWSVSRHANYAGYALWRAGYAMISGGLVAGLVVGGMQVYDFVTRGIPSLESYCSERYGAQWDKYTQDVKCALLPGIY